MKKLFVFLFLLFFVSDLAIADNTFPRGGGGGGSVSDATANMIAYYTGSGTVGGESGFEYDPTTNTFKTTDFIVGGGALAVGEDITSALVAYYKMEGTSGTTVTDSAGTNTGTSSRNLSIFTTTGKLSNGFVFATASSDFVDCGSSSTLMFAHDFSVAFWMKTTTAGLHRIGGNRHPVGNNPGWDISQDASNHISFTVDIGASSLSSIGTTDIHTGDWFFVVATRNAGVSQIWVNGTTEGTPSSANDTAVTGQTNTYFGKTPFSTPAFDGTLDNLQLFNRALTQAEITALYNSGTGTESLTPGKEDKSYQVVATSAPITTAQGLSSKKDLLVEGKIEAQSTVYGTSFNATSGIGCLMMTDTDSAGYTECTFLNGVMSCGTDADGVCDGTA